MDIFMCFLDMYIIFSLSDCLFRYAKNGETKAEITKEAMFMANKRIRFWLAVSNLLLLFPIWGAIPLKNFVRWDIVILMVVVSFVLAWGLMFWAVARYKT
jgi:hypothetical protein